VKGRQTASTHRKTIVAWLPHKAVKSCPYIQFKTIYSTTLPYSKSVKDLYFAPTRSALPSSSILKIISVGKCEFYSMGLIVYCKTSFAMHQILLE
jgi:hypothetical protein